MLLDAQMEVTAHVAYINRITRITLKFIHNAETKPSLVNQQCVVYEFQCNSCDSNYIGYTSRHLHLRIEEHKYSVIGKHLKDKHNQTPTNLHEQFTTLKKMPQKIWGPYLWDAFDKEEETDSEHSKWLHSSETVYLNISHSFVMYFLTYSFLYNGHYLVIICIW